MTFYRYHIFLFLTQIVHKLDNHIDSTILSYPPPVPSEAQQNRWILPDSRGAFIFQLLGADEAVAVLDLQKAAGLLEQRMNG